MGSAYVLTSELVSQMLRTYGHGDPLIYRRLLLWYLNFMPYGFKIRA